ncbi:unnamed protein product [Parnassius mnemosyne]|uniref:ATPase dynein-related AAA domain-containing protein n=2 Tax=Parnassius mnemosyne TaxID=213953 RepID=A0AAV1KBS1_9NEOP
MELLLKDIQQGKHILLVEKEGSENKKTVEKLLQHMDRPSEYIQLDANTTIESLIEQPTDKNGTATSEDSPLVKAVKYGYVLVVEEVAEAPTNVTSSLNTLMESGAMLLSDGRRIVPKEIMNSAGGKTADFIPVHEDFRMIVMARGKGFPSLEKVSAAPLALKNGEIGITVKAVGSSPAITTVVMGGPGSGPHTATAIASGTAVATATALTHGTGTSTATALASGSSVGTATAHSYDAGDATATVNTYDSATAEAIAHAYDTAVATATANASSSAVIKAEAIAKGKEVITETQNGP